MWNPPNMNMGSNMHGDPAVPTQQWQAPPPNPRAEFDWKVQREILIVDPLATCIAPPFVAATHLRNVALVTFADDDRSKASAPPPLFREMLPVKLQCVIRADAYIGRFG